MDWRIKAPAYIKLVINNISVTMLKNIFALALKATPACRRERMRYTLFEIVNLCEKRGK